MERLYAVDNAAQLLRFLLTIPEAQLERLPIQLSVGEEQVEGNILIHAFDTTEEQGVAGRGFHISVCDNRDGS